MTLRDTLRLLRRYWILLFVLALVGLLSGFGAALAQTPQYQSTTRVYVSTPAATDLQDLTTGSDYVQSVVHGYASLASQPIVLDKVISSLGLRTSSGALAGRVDAAALDNTSLMSITVTDTSPTEAARIADSVASSLQVVVEQLSPKTGKGKTATDAVQLTVTQAAAVPSSPVSPNMERLALLGLVIGLVLAIVIAALRQALDTKIRNDADVRSVSEHPVLGAIGYDKTAASAPLIVQSDPRGLRAETFRVLRTNLQFLGLERPDNAFVFTSSTSSEGKSTTAANLAIVTAATGASVLLIDADLRRPKIADYLGINAGIGLAEVLSGQAAFDDVVQQWGDQKLNVLTAGSVPPNPSELLQGRRMTELLHKVARQYDVVILDAPPLLAVTDAAIIARRTAGAIVVAAVNRVRKPQLAASLGALANVEATVLGIVETMVPQNRNSYGYGYGYGHAEPAHHATPAIEPTRPREDALHS